MALNLYRLHWNCPAGRKNKSFSYEDQEARKGYGKRCHCTIHASGTLNRVFHRRSTGLRDWAAAKSLATQWQLAGSWEAARRIEPLAVPPAPDPTVVRPGDRPRTTFEDAVAAFVRTHELGRSAPATVKKYSIVTKQLREFAALRGYLYVDQFQPQDIRDWHTQWKGTTAAKKLEHAKAFFNFCAVNRWLPEGSPAQGIRSRSRRGDGVRTPFTDQQLAWMYEVAARRYGKDRIRTGAKKVDGKVVQVDSHWREYGGGNRYTGPGAHRCTGQDLIDFIEFSVSSGLRISDVVTFDIRKLDDQKGVIYAIKNGQPVYIWLKPDLVARLRARAAVHGPFIFDRARTTTDINVKTDVWRRKLKRLWKLVAGEYGAWDEAPTPHRFRYTFVRILLQEGWPVSAVAELIGDSEEIVRKHYASWCAERQDALTARIRAAFEKRPSPNEGATAPHSKVQSIR